MRAWAPPRRSAPRGRRRSLGGTLATALATLTIAPGVAAADDLLKGPYLQNVTTTSVTVMWETRDVAGGEVRIPALKKVIVAPSGDLHEVVVDGLEPGRRYQYEVAVTPTQIVGGELSTAPPPGGPFTFVVFGDSRENQAAHERVVERLRGEVPDFMLGTGDLVDEGAVEQQWQKQFFDVAGSLLRDNVYYPSLGNHDRQGRGRTADNFRRFFSLPENSPDPERYYAFTYASARMLVLDSNAYSFALTDQTVWIEQQLQAARLDPAIKHIFVSMHHPPYSISLHGGQSELREAWTPMFEKYGVAAVFSGHDHVYSRAEKNGVHYFISGGGGAPLYPRRASSAQIDLDAIKYFERVNHFLRVSVVGDFIEVDAVRADGSMIESVSWGARPTPETEPQLATATPERRIAAVGAGEPGADEIAAAADASAAAAAHTRRLGVTGLIGLIAAVLAGGALIALRKPS